MVTVTAAASIIVVISTNLFDCMFVLVSVVLVVLVVLIVFMVVLILLTT